MAPDGAVALLGTVEQVLAPSGLYRGHRGEVDARGRVHAATRHDEEIRAPAAALAAAAAREGYCGPLGVDAFSYADEAGGETLRPVCELNARFTLGTVVIGVLKRALPWIRAQLGIAPDQRRSFYFSLDAPAGGWPAPQALGSARLLPLWTEPTGSRPALLVAEDRAEVDRALGAGGEETA